MPTSIERLKELAYTIAGSSGSTAIKKLMLHAFHSTGFGIISVTSKAIMASLITAFRIYMGYRDDKKLKVEELELFREFADNLTKINEEILDYERQLKKKKSIIELKHSRGSDVSSEVKEAIEIGNHLDYLYEGLNDIYITSPQIQVLPPRVRKKYFECDTKTCNAVGKIRSNKLWGNIEDCCVEAPMIDIMDEQHTLREEREKLADYTYTEIDNLKSSLNAIKNEFDDLKKSFGETDVEQVPVPMVGSGRRKAKRLKSKRNSKTKKNKSKRNKSKKKYKRKSIKNNL